jgi:hypothetical protein
MLTRVERLSGMGRRFRMTGEDDSLISLRARLRCVKNRFLDAIYLAHAALNAR